LKRGFRNLNEKVYNYLQGPNEFIVTGTFKNWERWNDLYRIQTRTLTMGAMYDEMDPEDMKKMATMMPNAQSWISQKGSHMTFYDDQVPYFTSLLTFLKTA
jgi:proline iminopeptidase